MVTKCRFGHIACVSFRERHTARVQSGTLRIWTVFKTTKKLFDNTVYWSYNSLRIFCFKLIWFRQKIFRERAELFAQNRNHRKNRALKNCLGTWTLDIALLAKNETFWGRPTFTGPSRNGILWYILSIIYEYNYGIWRNNNRSTFDGWFTSPSNFPTVLEVERPIFSSGRRFLSQGILQEPLLVIFSPFFWIWCTKKLIS